MGVGSLLTQLTHVLYMYIKVGKTPPQAAHICVLTHLSGHGSLWFGVHLTCIHVHDRKLPRYV